MNLNILDMFHSILVIAVDAAEIILSLASGGLFKFAVESIWQNPNSPNIFHAFWYDTVVYCLPHT